MTHRFILEPYKSIASRHTCPECKHKRYFSRYIDTEGAISFPEYVGRCDREQKCGYHLTPKTYFEQNPEQCEQTQARERPFRPTPPPSSTSYIDEALVKQSMSHYKENKLFQFLLSQFGEDESLRLMKLYRVGTANHWQGSTVFWQTDIQGKVRTSKIMLYNPPMADASKSRTITLRGYTPLFIRMGLLSSNASLVNTYWPKTAQSRWLLSKAKRVP